METLLSGAAERALQFLREIGEQPVAPQSDALEALAGFDEPLPDGPGDPADTLALLDQIGSPATIASVGPRYFGFVTGGALPATLAANWLAGAWDQNAAFDVSSPVGTRIEDVTMRWLVDLLGMPEGTGVGFVTGATMANFSGLAAARHAILERQGWDVGSQGLFAAPEIQVVVGDEVHVSLLKALSMLGLGRDRLERVPVDQQGRMRPDGLPDLDERTILCIQAGNVNTGAFDPANEIIPSAQQANAWVHVDAAFGLWAAAAPDRAYLANGFHQADSWATDAHKWLNVPYDCGIVFVRQPVNLRAAMSFSAAYLEVGDTRQPSHYTPEMSRRARGIEVWAALRSLGRSGLADLVERSCRQATRFAAGLRQAGFEILNDVVLNQVLVSFGDDHTTKKVVEAVQQEGTLWAGGTHWQGRQAMRISVSSWATTDADVERSLEAIVRVARDVV